MPTGWSTHATVQQPAGPAEYRSAGSQVGAGTGYARAGGVGALGYEENASHPFFRIAAAPTPAWQALYVWLPLAHTEAMNTKVSRSLSPKVAPGIEPPNPSIEGTHNGGAQLRAPSRSAAPLCAPHVKR